MITIKKYPNRRLYNTSTSTYINLEGIQKLILSGESVVIVDSKTGGNVTTATLLLHALDAEIVEALIPAEWMQELMRMESNVDRISAIQHSIPILSDQDSESETQPEEKTVPKIATVQPVDMIVSVLQEEDSQSSDSDSEVTVVRGDDPPTEPIAVAKHDMSTPIDVQVSMDAWAVSGDIDESEIPSFWSDSSFEQVSFDEEFDGEYESSDDGLFEQPETIVVQQRESSVMLSSEKDDTQHDVDGKIQSISLEGIPDDSSEVESSSDTSESSFVSSSSPVSEDSSENPVQDGGQVSEDKNIEVSSTSAIVSATEDSNPRSKSDQMKARLAAMRAKLNR
mgnify:CR=1 FL=1